jgi:hypothetical protein
MKRPAFWTCVVALSLGATAAHAQIGGTGTPGKVPVWVDPNTIGDSVITQNSDGSLTVNAGVTLSPALDVQSGNSGATIQGTNTATTSGESAGVRGVSNGNRGAGVVGSSANIGVAGLSQICSGSLCTPTTGVAGLFATANGGNILGGAVVDVAGVFTPMFRVDSTGTVFANGGYQTGGADFAESLAVTGDRSQYEAGDVLTIATSGTRQVALARESYSTLVAGIYSTKPGVLATPHTMDDPRLLKEIPLAVIGIVPCKVTAANGAIKAGDLLVTSSVAGHAMKGTDRTRMLGAVVGKALEPLASGTGVIQVLVTLQ